MNQEEKVETIETICKRFDNPAEWLMIRITEMDDSTTTPLTGVLLAHDPDRDVIFDKSMGVKGLILLRHSTERLPDGCGYLL